MKNFISLVVFLILPFLSIAQLNKGKVVDVAGNAISEVTISSGNQIVSSALDGTFSINATIGDKITFSKLNFETITTKVSKDMTVQLFENKPNLLSEVVVVGYGTKKIGSITGSVSQIKAADILKTPSQNAMQAIQGKAAGINIVTNDEPGANPTIRIRGLGTLMGGRDPLYIIDWNRILKFKRIKYQ